MHRLNQDALLYCVVWTAVAMLGWQLAGLTAGLILSVGLFPVVILTSALILSRTGDFRLERAVRWGILGVSAIILILWGSAS